MFCSNAYYYLKISSNSYSRVPCSFNVLLKRFGLPTIKTFLINKKIVVNYCGKCPFCFSIKKNNYKKRVKAQFKLSKYSYLITLTFDNKTIFTLLNNDEKQKLTSLSYYSNLSKIQINNIIKNWKNKINRFYKQKIKLHYFLCGEYGTNTKRAHYHILLFLDKPLPNLIKENVRGNHYKSSIINSKQYALYDIQPTNHNLSCSSYLTKYLSKQENIYNYNYNYFQESFIYMLKKENIDLGSSYTFKNKRSFISFMVYFFLEPQYRFYFNFWLINEFNKCTNVISTQKEFIKKSSKLGISDDLYINYLNGVLNAYYLSKYNLLSIIVKNIVSKLFVCKIYSSYILPLLFLHLYYLIIFKLIDNERTNNLINCFYKNVKNDVSFYKNNDIF